MALKNLLGIKSTREPDERPKVEPPPVHTYCVMHGVKGWEQPADGEPLFIEKLMADRNAYGPGEELHFHKLVSAEQRLIDLALGIANGEITNPVYLAPANRRNQDYGFAYFDSNEVSGFQVVFAEDAIKQAGTGEDVRAKYTFLIHPGCTSATFKSMVDEIEKAQAEYAMRNPPAGQRVSSGPSQWCEVAPPRFAVR